MIHVALFIFSHCGLKLLMQLCATVFSLSIKKLCYYFRALKGRVTKSLCIMCTWPRSMDNRSLQSALCNINIAAKLYHFTKKRGEKVNITGLGLTRRMQAIGHTPKHTELDFVKNVALLSSYNFCTSFSAAWWSLCSGNLEIWSLWSHLWTI